MRLQTALKLRQDVADLDAQRQSERMLRHRLVIETAQRDGTLQDLRGSAPSSVANFWEMVGSLTRANHLNKGLMAELMGDGLCHSWQTLDSWVQRSRQLYLTADIFRDFEWLVHETLRIEPSLASFLAPPPSGNARMVEHLEGLIEVEVALRHEGSPRSISESDSRRTHPHRTSIVPSALICR